MLSRLWLRSFVVVLLLAPTGSVRAAPEDAAATAATWLEANQNADGSWGSAAEIRGLATSEAVIALRAYGRRQDAYFRGITWLENHALSSVDYRARRIVALLPHGDDVSADSQSLTDSFSDLNGLGDGWGLSSSYAGSALDTALAVQAFGALGVPAPQQDVISAVALLGALRALGTDNGVPGTVGAIGAGDPIVTAHALRAYDAIDGILSGHEASANLARDWLLATVTTADPALQQAHAALAVLRWNDGGAAADPWIAQLEVLQAVNGSWDTDPYVTAVALQALAAKLGTDASFIQQAVFIPDLGLRLALNVALGKNLIDAITRGEMLTLVDLDASGFGIEDLTGIEEAQNLESINLLGNGIADFTPLAALPNLTTIIIADACDVNGDGAIGAADAQIILQAIVNNTTLTAAEMFAADVAPAGAPDGILTAADAVPVLRAAAGYSVTACGN